MLPRSWCRRWPAAVVAIALVHEASAACAAAKWLPAKTDVVVTVNIRQFLEDHKNTEAIQEALTPWRLALRGDKAALRQYHRAHGLEKIAGITEREYLERARLLKSGSDSLGLNPLEDVHRITFAFRRGAADSWVVIVEGRFRAEPLCKAVQQMAQQTARSFKSTRMENRELWQVPGDANGVCLALLNDQTLAIAGRKERIAELAARAAGAKNDTLASDRQALLERAEQQHIAVFLDNADTLLAQADKLPQLLGGMDEALVKAVVAQVKAWTDRYGKDIVSASVGISIHDMDSRLHIGLVARKPEIAKELAGRLDGVRILAGIGAKATGDPRSRQLGEILMRARFSAADATVALHVPVPHAFVQAVAEDARTTLRPAAERIARQIMSIPLWRPLPPAPGDRDVEEVRDIAYRASPKADPIRHRLDLFVPRGKKNYPVVVLVHGGGWTIGDNRCCGLYSSVAHFLARHGIGVVLPNYRLSPAVMHPEHAKDVVHAVRWTNDHIGEHGGDPGRIYLMGHSAGGHLVALVATDESYLKCEGMRTRDLKGVIAVSGVYRIPPGTMEAFLGGNGSRSLRPDQLLPLRDVMGPVPMLPPLGISVKTDIFGPPFGNDAKVRADASPINHVHRDLPPFLILSAEHDLPTLADMATEFHKALLGVGCTAQLLRLQERNHNTLMFSIIRPDDPAARAVLKFIK